MKLGTFVILNYSSPNSLRFNGALGIVEEVQDFPLGKRCVINWVTGPPVTDWTNSTEDEANLIPVGVEK